MSSGTIKVSNCVNLFIKLYYFRLQILMSVRGNKTAVVSKSLSTIIVVVFFVRVCSPDSSRNMATSKIELKSLIMAQIERWRQA